MAKGQVRAVGGLVFIQRKPRVDDKRDVVMHGHVDGILQSVDLQKFRIVITGSIDCIIEFKQFLILTESHLKQSGRIGAAAGVAFVLFIWDPPLRSAKEAPPAPILNETSLLFHFLGTSIEISS